jgi:hypothetical protein
VTAGELVDYIRSLVPQAVATPTAQLLNLLTVAQEEVAREAKLPRRVVQYDNLTADNQLVLPDDARKESLVAVYLITKNDVNEVTASRSLPIYDFISASRYHPNWTTWEATDATRFIMYDPAHDPDCPRPAPAPSIASPASFRVIYVQRPVEITGLDTVVMSGKFGGLAPVLAYRVAYLLGRDAVMLREYERAMFALAGQARPAPVVVNNPLYLWNQPRGARG